MTSPASSSGWCRPARCPSWTGSAPATCWSACPPKVFEGAELPAELLDTHRSYLRELTTFSWKSAAHITGGGIPGNLPRALPAGLGYRLDLRAWEVPGIFREIQERGRVGEEEMFGTFNMGIGMVLVMDRGDVPEGANVIGEVAPAERAMPA